MLLCLRNQRPKIVPMHKTERVMSSMFSRVRWAGCGLLCLLCTALVLTPASAQELPWRSLTHTPDRPSLGYTPAVVPDPADASGESWYAYTPGYLWHTNDLGETMREVGGAGLDNLMISSLTIVPESPDILYVATGVNEPARELFLQDGLYADRDASRFEGDGVYRSEDGGETWVRLPFFPGVPPGEDLRILNSIATTSAGDTLLVTTRRRILRSLDAGQTWAAIQDLPALPFLDGYGKPPLIHYTSIYHHPRSLRHVFVTAHGPTRATSPGHYYVLASHDGGESWDYLRVDSHPPFQETRAQRLHWLLAADPRDANIFWAQFVRSGEDRKLFRSADGGQVWTEVPVVPMEGAEWWAGTLPALSLHVRPQGGDTLTLGYSIGHHKDGRLETFGQQGGSPVLFLARSPDPYLGYRYVEVSRQVISGAAPAWRVWWVVGENYQTTHVFPGTLPSRLYLADACTTPVPAGADPAHRYVAFRWWGYPGWISGSGKTSVPAHSLGPSRSVASDTPVPGMISHRTPYWDFDARQIHCHPHRYDILYGGATSWGVKGFGMPRGIGRLPPPGQEYTPVGEPFGRVEHDHGDHVGQISASRQHPDRIWVAGFDRKPWRSEDYGGSFMEIESYPIHPRPQTIHAHDASAEVLYTDRTVSMDGGESWIVREVADSLQLRSWDRVVSHPEDPAVIYACTGRGLARWDDCQVAGGNFTPRLSQNRT